MHQRRRATLRAIVETLAPEDARIDRVTDLSAAAIDGLTRRRNGELGLLLDLLWLPMKAPGAARARVLRALARAPAARLRAGFAALKRLTLFLAYAESEAGNENPTWSRIGYPGPRGDANASSGTLTHSLASEGERIRADLVVIGSGAGGGVIASAYARAGKRVVVLEAGGAYDAGTFRQREMMLSELYLDGGLTSTSDLGITILAGATLGGGTSVNWCTCLRLPARIGDEWGEQSGIHRLGVELDPHYSEIERRLEIAPAREHNANNRAILDGARALGLHAATSPRNASIDCADGCGYCGFGCAYGKKHSTVWGFLPDVTANGGAIYANAAALRVRIDGTRARGVVVRQTPVPGHERNFEVAADVVAVCAGALRTPGILARSGIAHPLLGKRLFLHPVAAAIAEFEHRIDPWNGPMQTAHSDAFNYSAGNYGAKIEVAPAHPGMAGLALSWLSRNQHSNLMSRIRNVATMFALTRDRDPGSVDLDDEAYIRYRVSNFDGTNMLAGLAGIFDLGFAAGAVRITTLHADPISIERNEWNAATRASLVRAFRRIGVAPNRQIFFSAHQMGTAAMGAVPRRSVTDTNGRVWGYENVLVGDASLFPQSSGVNPMLTIMAMASRIAAANLR